VAGFGEQELRRIRMGEDETGDPLDVVDEVRERTCEQCGKPLNKRQARFCCRKCYAEWQSDSYQEVMDVERIKACGPTCDGDEEIMAAHPEEFPDFDYDQWEANLDRNPYEDDMDTPIDEDEDE
jgi:hypothetical protein